jgi:hypothetical protein
MAAKGTESKIEVGNKIINSFGEKAFWNIEGKEIRINVVENGEPLQIKVAFTVAKNAVELGDAEAILSPYNKGVGTVASGSGPAFPEPKEDVVIEASVEEKNAVADLMKELGL